MHYSKKPSDCTALYNISGLKAKKRKQLINRLEKLQGKLKNKQPKVTQRVLIASSIVLSLTIKDSIAQTNFTDIFNPYGFSLATLAFGDLDNDGDYDLIASGAIFKNEGTPQLPKFHLPDMTSLGHITGLGHYILVDIDADGDLDILGRTGTSSNPSIGFVENIGSPSVHQFSSLVVNPFGLSGITSIGKFIDVADFDGDGDFDIMTRISLSGMGCIENIGTPNSPQFNTIQVQQNTSYFSFSGDIGDVADLDADGDLDFLFGGGGAMNGQGEGSLVSCDATSTIPPMFVSCIIAGLGGAGGGNDDYFPYCVDIDADGDIDCFGGYNEIEYYTSPARRYVVFSENQTFDLPKSELTEVNIIENETYHFSIADFPYSSSNPLKNIIITSLPNKGNLLFQGNPVSVNDTVDIAFIADLSFIAEQDSIGTPYAQFDFIAADSVASTLSTPFTINVQPFPNLNTDFQINTTTRNNQRRPSISADSQGNRVIVWETDEQTIWGYNIQGQIIDANGKRIGQEFRVNTNTIGNQENPSVKMTTNGQFIASWNNGEDISYTHFDNSGNPLASSFWFPEVTWVGNAVSNYNLAINTNGDIARVAVYLDQNSGNRTIQVKTSVGNFIVTQQLSYTPKPVIAINDAGDIIVVWQDDLGDIIAKYFDNSGILMGMRKVNDNPINNLQHIKVVYNNNGTYVVIWESQDSSGSGIYGRVLNGANAISPEFQINTYTNLSQTLPEVVSYGNNNFIVVWQSEGQDGDGLGVFARFFDNTGNPLSSEIQINDYTIGHQQNPAIAVDGNDVLTIAWDSEGQDGDGSGIYIKQYLPFAIVDTEKQKPPFFLNQIKCFPNPATHNLMLEFEATQSLPNTIFRIFSTTGQKMLEKRVNLSSGVYQKTLSIQDWAAGMYVVQLIYEEGVLVKTFIKQ